MLLLVVLGFLLTGVRCNITGTNPPSGSILCLDKQYLLITYFSSDCNSMATVMNDGSCYVYEGVKQQCKGTESDLELFPITFEHGGQILMAGVYLVLDNSAVITHATPLSTNWQPTVWKRANYTTGLSEDQVGQTIGAQGLTKTGSTYQPVSEGVKPVWARKRRSVTVDGSDTVSKKVGTTPSGSQDNLEQCERFEELFTKWTSMFGDLSTVVLTHTETAQCFDDKSCRDIISSLNYTLQEGLLTTGFDVIVGTYGQIYDGIWKLSETLFSFTNTGTNKSGRVTLAIIGNYTSVPLSSDLVSLGEDILLCAQLKSTKEITISGICSATCKGPCYDYALYTEFKSLPNFSFPEDCEDY